MLTGGLDHSGHYDHDRDESALLCNASAVLSGREHHERDDAGTDSRHVYVSGDR